MWKKGCACLEKSSHFRSVLRERDSTIFQLYMYTHTNLQVGEEVGEGEEHQEHHL